jgi:hypothetical protein
MAALVPPSVKLFGPGIAIVADPPLTEQVPKT